MARDSANVIPLGQRCRKAAGGTSPAQPTGWMGLVSAAEDLTYDRVGTASWYDELFHGRRTANGEI